MSCDSASLRLQFLPFQEAEAELSNKERKLVINHAQKTKKDNKTMTLALRKIDIFQINTINSKYFAKGMIM